MSSSVLERASPARLWDPRLACAVALALVFLCGAAVGALVMDLGVHRRNVTPAFDTPQGKAAFFDRMNRELKLTPAQSEQMQSILTDFWDYYRTVLSDGKSRIEQILTPEQRQKFEAILQEHQHPY
jgi:Spy/CpxP family protein refolding chaperone